MAAPDVVGHLDQQGVDRVEAHGRPQPGDQLDPDPLAVQVQVGPVQDVRLDPALVPSNVGFVPIETAAGSRASTAPSASSGRTSHPAYTPSAGTTPVGWASRFAVG